MIVYQVIELSKEQFFPIEERSPSTKRHIKYYESNKRSIEIEFPRLCNIVGNLLQFPQLSHSSNLLAKAVKLHQKPNANSIVVLNNLIQRYLQKQ